MVDTSEEALLLAIETRNDLFGSIREMLSSDNYLKVLMVVNENKRYTDMADDAGVSKGTVSNAIGELRELELVEQTEEGYKKTLPVLEHPIIQHFFEEEVVVE